MAEQTVNPAEKPTSADAGQAWKQLFRGWPAGVPTRGVVVTILGEQIPFEAFQLTEAMMLFDRPTPDTVGARRIFLPFANIAAIKITEVTQEKAFQPLGFSTPHLAEKPKAERPRRPFVP